MFENFNKKPDEADALPGKVAVAAIVLMLLGIPALYIYRTMFPHEVIVDGFSVLDEATARRVQNLCGSLPKPEKFELEAKRDPYPSPQSTLVIYRYRSPRSPEEIMPAFIVWFKENGWERDPVADSTYRKAEQSVYISSTIHYDYQFTDYNIYCSEKK